MGVLGIVIPITLGIIGHLSETRRNIFGDRPLLQLWAYHYDSSMTGIGMHADFAAVNVNFWLTPNEAMLDPESGGMRIWDVEAPAHWRTEDFNTADPETKRQIDTFLATEGARELVVPHRRRRAGVPRPPPRTGRPAPSEPDGDLQFGPVPPHR